MTADNAKREIEMDITIIYIQYKLLQNATAKYLF